MSSLGTACPDMVSEQRLKEIQDILLERFESKFPYTLNEVRKVHNVIKQGFDKGLIKALDPNYHTRLLPDYQIRKVAWIDEQNATLFILSCSKKGDYRFPHKNKEITQSVARLAITSSGEIIWLKKARYISSKVDSRGENEEKIYTVFKKKGDLRGIWPLKFSFKSKSKKHEEINKVCLGLKLADTDLSGEIKKSGKFSEENELDYLYIIYDLLYGLKNLYENQIIHGDLKPANILLGRNKFGKRFAGIADFEGAHFQNKKCSKIISTHMYLSPERFELRSIKKKYYMNIFDPTFESDVWAVGLVIDFILRGCCIFGKGFLKKIKNQTKSIWDLNYSIKSQFEQINRNLQLLVNQMTTYSPKDRLGAIEAFDFFEWNILERMKVLEEQNKNQSKEMSEIPIENLTLDTGL